MTHSLAHGGPRTFLFQTGGERPAEGSASGMREGKVSDLGFRRGRRGEALALEFLERRKWRILDRNWRDGPRELDAVAVRANVLAFVEVKTRSLGNRAAPGSGADLNPRDRALTSATTSLTWRKRREIQRAARAWMAQHRILPAEVRTRMFGCGWPSMHRFDLVVVLFVNREDREVIHMPDAWRPGWTGG